MCTVIMKATWEATLRTNSTKPLSVADRRHDGLVIGVQISRRRGHDNGTMRRLATPCLLCKQRCWRANNDPTHTCPTARVIPVILYLRRRTNIDARPVQHKYRDSYKRAELRGVDTFSPTYGRALMALSSGPSFPCAHSFSVFSGTRVS